MRGAQRLLFADPQPLVERLGAPFFRQLPEAPGVYLMRDGSEAVLYVGKAKDLRKRLGSYRVANPDRMPARMLRLLRQVRKIECETCLDEPSALARESELLLSLRPRFNRAGVWPKPVRYLLWRTTADTLQIAVSATLQEGWQAHGPLSGGAASMRTSLVRVIWRALQPTRGTAGMPAGWVHGRLPEMIEIRPECDRGFALSQVSGLLGELTEGKQEGFLEWVRNSETREASQCETALMEEDLERVVDFFTP